MTEAPPPPCRVWTAHAAYRGDDGLDVSRAGGHPLGSTFAPSWGLLRWGLAERRKLKTTTARDADWAEYGRRYLAEMRAAYRANRRPFDELLGRGEVVLLCHCRRPERCHRGLLARLLVKLGSVYEGERAGDDEAEGSRADAAAP